MKIYVIIVTYNGAKWVKACFDSIKQSNIPLETIVIDNNSSDNTVELIKKQYSFAEVIETGTNLGFGKANNIGIEKALKRNADYVFLLNQDASIYSNTIELLIEAHQKNTEYGILSPIQLNEQLNLDTRFFKYTSNFNALNFQDFLLQKKGGNVYQVKFVNAALWLISKECLLKLKGFNPFFQHYGEDNNFVDTCHFYSFKIGIVPFSFGIHYRNQEILPLSKLSLSKGRYNFYTILLKKLLNLNHSFLHVYFLVLNSFIRLFLKGIIQLKFNLSIIAIFSIVKIHFNLKRILENRNKYLIS